MNHGGIAEIIATKQCPSVRNGWGRKLAQLRGGQQAAECDGEYISGLAEYSGDPNAYCATRREAEEKMKRKGLEFTRT